MYNEIHDDYYGKFIVDGVVFDRIGTEMCISGSTDNVKYFCANPKEAKYLSTFGLETTMTHDYFKVVRKETYEGDDDE